MTPVDTTKPEKTTVIEVPEAVGVFDSFETLQQAFYDLRMAGFSRYDISLLGHEKTLKKKLGDAYWRTEDLEDDPDVPRAAFVSEEAMGEMEGMIVGGVFFIPSYIAMVAAAAAGGAVAATAAAVAIVGLPAAVIGALLARRADKHHRDYYAQQVERGGILLWVRVDTTEKQARAVDILKSHSGKDVHVHDWSR
ncbi:hypothetical protein [Aliiroseovarius sediminis]|uniref:hypothetical protein n=1 Tax=Aliiroseovarius sediminis TaxID=2925839 RepID=UPI001F562E72|nr:hypothetical protein [Aliiroseovarius sediminis]MCI2395982.1 hypothetical protein [Aliiroseovarius sediminis]